MTARDLLTGTQHGRRAAGEDALSQLRVAAHLGKLVRCQLLLLQEHRVGYSELADVVQGCSIVQELDLAVAQAELLGEEAGRLPAALGVREGVVVSILGCERVSMQQLDQSGRL